MDSSQRNDTFKSISGPAEGLYKEKGSKFFAFAYPVVSEEEVRAALEKIRKEYYDARHHCYAYRLGLSGDVWRYNDDGEPSSTAGRPIYGQILSRELSDVLIVVVRYFRGRCAGPCGGGGEGGFRGVCGDIRLCGDGQGDAGAQGHGHSSVRVHRGGRVQDGDEGQAQRCGAVPAEDGGRGGQG